MTNIEKKQWLANWNSLINEIDMHNSLDSGWSATKDEQLKYHKRLLLQDLVAYAGGVERILSKIRTKK